MEPSTSLPALLNESLSRAPNQSASPAPQTAQNVSSETTSSWLGRIISTWPTWLSTPTFALLPTLNLDVQTPDARERRELRRNIMRDVAQIILEYRVPADIEEAIRDVFISRGNSFGEQLPASLTALFVEHASFIPLVSELDLHDIDCVPEIIECSAMRIKSCAIELSVLASYLPHLRRLNFSNCNIGNMPERIIPTITDKALFPHVEVLDLSSNNLILTMQNGPFTASNTLQIADVMKLPKLKTLIVKHNRILQADKEAAKARYPHLNIIDQ